MAETRIAYSLSILEHYMRLLLDRTSVTTTDGEIRGELAHAFDMLRNELESMRMEQPHG
jgi:hypothetical protein